MEKIIEELPLEALPGQFWGAVRIYTEKPHIINRRICGTVNLWIGISHEVFSRQNVVKSLEDKVFLHNFVDEVDKCKRTPANIYQDENLSECDINIHDAIDVETPSSSTNNILDQDKDFEPELKQIDVIKDVLFKEGFRSIQEKSDLWCNKIVSQDKTKEVDEDDNCKEQSEAQLPKTTLVKNRQLKIPWQDLLDVNTLRIAVIRRILPKVLKKFTPLLEVVLMDGKEMCVSYLAATSTITPSVIPRVNYSFFFTKTGISLSYFTDKDGSSLEGETNIVWVQKNVLPKLMKWTGEVDEDGTVENKGSLRLVDVQEYNQLYQKLKIKYGQSLVKIWPESTDPQKYVFEDIAIATYLILVWEQERKQKGLSTHQTFVDLGCGNGLLVHILSSEGHQGLGIDIKKRNIWDMFPEHTKLKEGVVEPSDKNLFPQYDWLIGNHSDELTPWLPVIAAKSRYTTRFFVIPCCAHDFDCRYRRKCAGRSQYSDYLEYIKEIGTVCGFEVWQDKLRIPSTKRVCLIGQERTYSASQSHQTFQKIDEFIRERTHTGMNNTENQKNVNSWESHGHKKSEHENHTDALWSENFKARAAVQPVRNCTQLEHGVREDLVSTVAKMLMEKKHIIQVEVSKTAFVNWDRGGRMTLSDIAKRMESNQLSALKKECGGLQTLLRNHKHIFNILQREVSLQVPVPEWKATVPKTRIKTKHCWFHINHVKGCPLPSQTCIYAHGDEDLKKS
ncbi:probable tRNA (uracil-O(2)-)-methyltransferase [Homarus americanus]|nr:probable tRNA (uracil-O(2)-)-methyltransferase [Homarus americanus]XP_042207029.1 probable tRNA (uracil-O(2)-)-methyltransferase [Homarus americanus]XP_042207030.1 probable tRNA (uracil-O(2)-)-methyltransferase [Homarus americanus]XP_042207031.1 probable tRNA (uracil-O(2)-)-methyltransferase [Homarus americanus]